MSAGAGETVLLLHGQPGSARDWDGVVAAIGSRARTVAPDRPGWDGRSAATGLDGNAGAALAAAGAAGVDAAQPMTVVGHSFGAAVAAWLAVRHPERVGALVLVAPAVNTASLYALDRWLAAPAVGLLSSAVTLGGLGAVLSAGPARRRIARRAAIDERYLQGAGRRLLAPTAWRSFVHEQRVLVRELPGLEARLGEIAAPTVVVAGARDIVVPAASVRRLAGQIPGAEVRRLARAGHVLPLVRPGAVAEIVVAASAAAAAASEAGPA